MKVKIKHIEALLDQLSIKTKQSLDHSGFKKMSEMMEVADENHAIVSDRYLYDALFRKSKGEIDKGKKDITVQPYNLDSISRYLGFKNFAEFEVSLDSTLDPVLIGCVGTYRCYLRRNTEKGIILLSPVRIYEKDKKILIELRGPEWIYRGEVAFKNNCLFILMKADNGKEFHHVYQIGQKVQPNLLQGVFSGVSTSFEPIGGRVVLIRTSDKFETISNVSMEIKTLKKSKKLEERRLAEYFFDYSSNNLATLKSMTYSIDDLGKNE